jgi:ribosomal protein S18 acetylase RimI-like enzyme
MTGDLSIRRYRPGDDDRIRELHEEAMRDAGALIEDDPAFEAALPDEVELDTDLEAISETYVESGGTFLVGCVERGSMESASGEKQSDVPGGEQSDLRASDAEIVATGAFSPVDDATVEIKRMRADPAYQRRGYGQRILDALEAEAIERGFTEFTLDTLARQTAARGFYEANGYEEFDRESFGGHEVCFYRKTVEG